MNQEAIKLIKRLRNELGLTRQDLTVMMGYKSKSVVSQVERGKTSISPGFCRRLVKIARDNHISYIDANKLIGD
jgi:transcriptional regulator with XRE-family HTH domain